MTSTRPSLPARRWALVAILVAGSCVRVAGLDRQSAWIDELHRVVWAKGHEFDRVFGFLPTETGARLPPRSLGAALRVVNTHNPPLNAAVLNGWMRATGSDRDFVARLPMAAFGALSILGAYLAASVAVGSGVGLWVAALVAFSPFHVFHAQEINHYALGGCLVSFSLWFWFRWLQRRNAADGVGLALTGTAALYTHYFAVVVLALQATEVLLRHRRDPRGLAIAAAPYAAIAAGFAPYLATMRRQVHEMTSPAVVTAFRGWDYFAERLQALGVVPWLGERGEYLPSGSGVVLCLLWVAVIAVGLSSVGDKPTRRALAIMTIGPVVLVSAAYWVTRGNSVLWSRYQLFFSFAPFIVTACALHRVRWLRWIAAPAVALLFATGLRFHYGDLVKEDWRSVARHVEQRGSPTDAVIVHRAHLTYAVARYLQSDNRLFGVDAGDDLARRIAIATAGGDAAWFASAWDETPEVPRAVHEHLGCRFERREDMPVAPGRVGLALTRYSGRRALSPARPCSGDEPGTFAWETPAGSGPGAGKGNVDFPAALAPLPATGLLPVSGWAFWTDGIQQLAFEVDGVVVARLRHPGLWRPDVAAAFADVPSTHTLNSGFWALIQLPSRDPGPHRLVVHAIRTDATSTPIAAREFELEPGASATP